MLWNKRGANKNLFKFMQIRHLHICSAFFLSIVCDSRWCCHSIETDKFFILYFWIFDFSQNKNKMFEKKLYFMFQKHKNQIFVSQFFIYFVYTISSIHVSMHNIVDCTYLCVEYILLMLNFFCYLGFIFGVAIVVNIDDRIEFRYIHDLRKYFPFFQMFFD